MNLSARNNPRSEQLAHHRHTQLLTQTPHAHSQWHTCRLLDLLFFKDEEVGFMNELADREEMLAPASLLAWEADDSLCLCKAMLHQQKQQKQQESQHFA